MKRALAAALTFLVIAATPVLATSFTISDVDGAFSSALPPGTTNLTIVNGDPLSTIRWGEPFGSDQQSGYDFLALVPPPIVGVVPPTTAWLPLADFTHHNFPITGTFLTSVDLDVTLTMDVGGSPFTPTFSYLLTHEETLNSAPCAYPGGAPCADRVTIDALGGGNVFAVGNTIFTLNLGFSQDGGATVTTDFVTLENLANSAGLYGQLSSTVIPEPGTWAMLGLGLAGLMIRRWPRRRASLR